MTLETITITDECKHIEITWDNRQYKIPMSVIKDEFYYLLGKESEKMISFKLLTDINISQDLLKGKLSEQLKAEHPGVVLSTWYSNVLNHPESGKLSTKIINNMIADFKEIFASRMQFMDAYIVY